MGWKDEVVGPDVASAGVHVSERIGRDVAAQCDLEESLEASRYASHPYSSHPKEWLPLYEVAESRELPPVLIEKYNAAGGEGTALCGVFPEIRRAWASVDNALFLWRFDKCPLDRMTAAFSDASLRTGLLPRIFGCTAYVHDSSPTRTKLDARALRISNSWRRLQKHLKILELWACLSAEAMQVLEGKIRSLEMFLRSRRNQRRGLYGFVAGLGDHSGIKARSLLNPPSQNIDYFQYYIAPEEMAQLLLPNFLSKVPESADLRSLCKRFEDLRFYEAVVRLPLQKAQSLDPENDAGRRECYEIVAGALQSLTSDSGKSSNGQSLLDQSAKKKYTLQIVQLSVQWPDQVFHEYLYGKMIDLGLENELLDYGGLDLVPFLQSAGREHSVEGSVSGQTVKYLDLLAKYYVLKRQHHLAAHVLYRLAERRCTDSSAGPTLEQRQQYLSNALLQAKSSTAQTSSDGALLEMLEGKLTVLRFQMKIKEELEYIATSMSEERSTTLDSSSGDPFPRGTLVAEENSAEAARAKSQELGLDLKSITQLYNEYAVPFELWEVCLEMLNFARYSGDADSQIVRETWARLLDQALSRGGVAEACAVVKRVGSVLYPGDGASIPLNTLCLHLEKSALERSTSRLELVGDEDVARALLVACKGSPELLLNIYDQVLSNGAVVASPSLRLRLLRSVLTILREWAASGARQRSRSSFSVGISHVLGRGAALPPLDEASAGDGFRDKVISAANRYMTEVRRLALPQSQMEAVCRGFRELEDQATSPYRV
ncbi:nucleoporin 155 [Wolffia australiana]